MLQLKKFWSHLTGFVFLILMVTPAFAQFDTSAPTAVCLIGNNPGIDDTDSQTAAMLVCDELRKQGISVSDPVFEAPASANVYRVALRRLGEKIFVRLSHESPIGTVIAERQMTLANIEEMIPAAPRLVDALVHGKPIDATVDMETVAEQEARELRKISGESLWNVGIFGTTIPGTEIIQNPGGSLVGPTRRLLILSAPKGDLVETRMKMTATGSLSSVGRLVDATFSTNRTFHRMWAADSPLSMPVT